MVLKSCVHVCGNGDKEYTILELDQVEEVAEAEAVPVPGFDSTVEASVVMVDVSISVKVCFALVSRF